MHVIIFFSVYLSFYEKFIIISKCIYLGLIIINFKDYIVPIEGVWAHHVAAHRYSCVYVRMCVHLCVHMCTRVRREIKLPF